MSKVYNRQSRLWPSSTPTTFENGDGVNTREAFDLTRMLNNLLLCEAGAGMTPGSASSTTPGYVRQNLFTGSSELYMCQKPIRVPPLATSFRWIIGFGAHASGVTSQTATTTTQTVYLSTTPYTGPGAAEDDFDPANLARGYVSQSTGVTITAVGTDALEYTWAGGNGGALSAFRPGGVEPWQEHLVYMIVTMTGSCSSSIEGTDNHVIVYDEAHWFGWS